MALDLFANYERSSNSSLFYRAVSATPHDVIFKLGDVENPELDLIEVYQAEYSINGGSRQPMIDLQSCQRIARSTPTNFTFTAFVSTINPLSSIGSFTLTGKYISSLPQADFVIYPSIRINENDGTSIALNSTNYFQSSGTYFYGEGHTEIVNLSSNYATAVWYVGNPLSAVQQTPSTKPVVTSSTRTATVSLTSALNTEASYDVSLLITNSDISQSSPIFSYNDASGQKEFYPFFKTTYRVTGDTEFLNTDYLRTPIRIKQYPIVSNYQIVSQLSSTPTTLPYDYTNQRFLALTSPVATDSQFLSETFYGTQWKIEAVANTQEPNPDWSYETTFNQSISGYSFCLGYLNEDNVNDYFFKCSAGFNTTVTTTASAYKISKINLLPFDWKCKTLVLPLTSVATVERLPVGQFFTSSYYYLTGEKVKIYNITNTKNLNVRSITLSSQSLSEPLIFNAGWNGVTAPEYEVVSFDDVGSMTMTATINFIDNQGRSQYITTILKDFIEIVSQYDYVEPESFRSVDSAPSSLTDAYPKISPNEWVTEDNINSIFKKFYGALDELRSYARSYNTTNKIIGRLEPYAASGGEQSCLGTYCLDWKWKSLKALFSSTFVTWTKTKIGQALEAKWKSDECGLLKNRLSCPSLKPWIVPSIDPSAFTEWKCLTENSSCNYAGVCKLDKADKLIIAYQNTIHVLDNNYVSTFLGEQYFVDEVFQFQDIAGIASTTDEMIVVLDSTIPRVSVFSLDNNNKFILFTTWGRYGLSNSKTGFNKPRDLHVDKHNNVYICDTGNECVKKLTVTGRHISTFESTKFENNPPISICVDNDERLHCLTQDSTIMVFDKSGNFVFDYFLPENLTGIKINSSYEGDATYVTFDEGVAKFFKTGIFSHYIAETVQCTDLKCANETWKSWTTDCKKTWKTSKCGGSTPSTWKNTADLCAGITKCDPITIKGFKNLIHDSNRNLYVVLNNSIIKIIDRMTIDEVSYERYAQGALWSLNSILIDKEEYVQPWVYLRAFHRLWDNIELFRNSLFYEVEGCKSFNLPTYSKENLKLGQNEIVTNASINRLSEQLWINLQSISKYFDPTCKN